MKKLLFLLVGLSLAVLAHGADFVTDTFTDVNGTTLGNHTGEVGATWTVRSGLPDTVIINTNRLYSNTTDSLYTASGTPPGVEYYVQCSFRRLSAIGGQEFSIYGRWGNSGLDGYRITAHQSDLTLYLHSGGSFTVLATVSETWVNGVDHTIRLEIKDATKKMFLDGVEIASSNDNTLTSAGLTGLEMAGVGSSTTGWVINDFSAAPNASGPTAGTVTPVVTSATTVTVSATACTGGTANFSYQYERAPDSSGSPGTYADVGSARTGVGAGVAPSALNDTGLTTGNTYWYRYTVTDAGSFTSTSAGVAVTVRVPATYYVSSAGNDSNNGTTTGTPWLTITKVNSTGMQPGDTVLFNGGDTFTGNLLINPSSQPSAALPIIVGSYGTGNATISCGNSYGVKVLDAGYVTVENLTITGSGVNVSGTYPNKTSSTTSTEAGLVCEVSTVATWRYGIVVDSVTVSGCLNGIQTRSSNASSTAIFDGLRISNCTVHNCAFSGIAIWGTNPAVDPGVRAPSNRYLRILNCNVYDIWGQTARTDGTGFGIIFFFSTDSIVDSCRTHNIAIACKNTASNGPAGILTSMATRCTIRRCDVSLVYSPSLVDGCGIDLDGTSNDCVIENSFVHECYGAGLFLWQGSEGTHGGSILRYNVVQNCGIIDGSNDAAGFGTVGSVGTPLLYHNTFFNVKATGGESSLLNSDRPCLYYNNIFSIGGSGAVFGTCGGSSPSLIGNTYNVRTGASFSINTGTTYTSLAGLQGAGLETSGGAVYGASGDPLFYGAGNGVEQLPTHPVSNLTNYNLRTGSVARGAGVNQQRFSLGEPLTDLHGNPGAGGATATFNGVDSGAVRFGSQAQGAGVNGSAILGMQ